MWRRSLIAIGALVFIAVAYIAYTQIRVAVAPVVGQQFRITIPKGHGLNNILWDLRRKGIDFSDFGVSLYVKWNDLAHRLQAGTYDIPAEASLKDIFDKLHKGDVVQYFFTIVEGWSLNQVLVAMEADEYITMNSTDPDEISRALDLKGSAEGWIHPQTYLISVGTDHIELLRRAYAETQELLLHLWNTQRPGDFPLKSPYEALILASIVEKEAYFKEEQPIIAGVFLERLRRRMRLQSDPTVIYGLQDRYDGTLSKADLKHQSPYNTYLHKGLPPTPIAMPGKSALEAVFSPEISAALYFVAKGDGSHHFSATYEEHREAVKKYRKNQ